MTDETTKAVQALIELQLPGVEADVIVGGSNARREEIKKLCAPYPFLHYYCQVSNMAEFMAKADLCLGAGGSTTWERLFLDLPSIVTAIADNQIQICEDCAGQQMIDYMGWYSEVDVEKIKSAVTKKFLDA